MRIGINALLISMTPSYRSAGVSSYTLSLLNALKAFDQRHQYLIFVSERAVADQVSSPSTNVAALVGRSTAFPASRVLWEHLCLAREARRNGLHLLHAPVNILPLGLSCPGIVTIHDLAVLRFPELFRPARRLYQQAFIRRSVRRAALVIAVSEHTRRDLIDLLGIPEEQIRVIYPILEERFFHSYSAEAVNQFRKHRQLPEQMILCLATLEPRKNIGRLIDAYHLLKRETQFPHTLVLAGPKGWYYQTFIEQVHRLGLEDDVRFVGFVPEEEKNLWYHAADLFVYPSRYEGFGLPVAEAMACGVPVVTSNVSSLPEVVGDSAGFGERAALTVAPDDTEALARAMQQGLSDQPLRQLLHERGLARARRFAPGPIAQQIIQAYQDAAGLNT